jgi:hypothetical protein
MIQETRDIKLSTPSLADELADTPGGPVLAAMRAGFVVWGSQIRDNENNSWMRRAKDHAEYALKIGLIDLRVKEEAFTRGALREKPELTKRDLDERIKFNQTLTPQDISLRVGAATKLDAKTVTAWLSARKAVKKKIGGLLATSPGLRDALADSNAGNAEILKSRNQLSRLLATAGWKGK